MSGYIFLCNEHTKQEVFSRQLMGTTRTMAQQMPVKKGDILFLYDYTNEELHGIFSAEEDAQLDWAPDAWKGKYPWQVPFRVRCQCAPLLRHEFAHLVKWYGEPPKPHLCPVLKTDQAVVDLERAFVTKGQVQHG